MNFRIAPIEELALGEPQHDNGFTKGQTVEIQIIPTNGEQAQLVGKTAIIRADPGNGFYGLDVQNVPETWWGKHVYIGGEHLRHVTETQTGAESPVEERQDGNDSR